jgi:tetratricopeptide (TPR) repeat protein
MHRSWILALLVAARGIEAQCPDGSPPPCATRRAAPPAPNLRARHFMLLPFRNVTKKAEQEWLVVGSPLMIGQILGQLRDIDVVPDEGLSAARRKIGIEADATPDAAQLRKLADETGGWTAVTGNVFATGNRLRITAQAMDVPTSRVLVRAETEIALDADPREAFDKLSIELLEPAGVPPTTATLATVTTASLDAFRSYVRGLELYQRSRFRDAEAEFTRAVTVDSTFSLAWAAIAATSLSTGGVQTLLNPLSKAYRASERAAQLSNRLPPREARFIRAIQALFHGEMRRGRREFDAVLAANPANLDAAFWVAASQVLAPPVDTAVRPPRLDSNLNRAVALARMILERDPRRRTAYVIPLMIYGLGGGVMWGDVYGYAREYGSFGATLMMPPDLRAVPVMQGDSIALVPRSAFDSLPPGEQQRLRRRNADEAWEWAQRWLIAGPEDADAHLWAARIATLREDHERALVEFRTADSLGIQSTLENRLGWKVALLLLAGHNQEAADLADAALAAGTLTNAPFLRVFDQRRSYGAAALLLSKRWDRVAKMAELMGAPPGETACASLRREMAGFQDAVLPHTLRRAVMDTVTAHLPEITANVTLAPCAETLSKRLWPG